MVAKVETLLKCGYRDVLGFADQNYWDVLCEHFDHTRVNNTDDCIGVQVYGDEATIFDGLSYMCIAWSSRKLTICHFESMLAFSDLSLASAIVLDESGSKSPKR